MPDLLANAPRLRPGQGNAAFLCDLADNVPCETMRRNYTRGEYPNLNPTYARGWRRLFGRM